MRHLNVFLIIMLLVVACRQTQNVSTIRPNYVEKYLTEHSPGTISVKDPVILRFKPGIVDSLSWEDRYFSIKPQVAGKITWIDRTTLQFDPSQILPYSTAFKIEVSPKAFKDASGNQKLELNIQTKKLEYTISLDEKPTYDNTRAKITGTLKSSDWVMDKAAEDLLDYSSGDISWVHSQNGKNHHFTIYNVERKSMYEEMKITWEDQINATTFSGNKAYAIAPIGLFEVSHIQAVPETNKVEISFTDELDGSQKLDGFFRINGKLENLKYAISGSVLSVYLENDPEKDFSFTINKNIKSSKGKVLASTITTELKLAPTVPEVRMVGNGVITPYTDEILFPFEAKGLHAVDVEILKVFSNNIMQYLQNYDLNSYAYYLENVGRIIHQETILLSDLKNNPDYNSWKRYAIDLQKLIDPDPEAIYVVRIGFRKSYTDYPCEQGVDEEPLNNQIPYQSIMRWNSDYDGYQYSHESDPCYPVFYNSNRFIQRNILASNLGIIAKGNKKNGYQVYLRNLKTLEPESEAQVSFYDFQQQIIMESMTGVDGSLRVDLNRNPGFIIAQKGKEYAYVSLRDQASNSLSDFDIGGTEKQDGLDGFIYGERGVWRPGDTLHLTFILEDKLESLPSGYPLEMMLKDSRGQIKFRKNSSLTEGNMYVANIPTEQNDPTGNWQYQVNVGGQSFYKTLKIETVKPNRLKVDLELPERVDIAKKDAINFSSSWLYGAPAKDLKARIEATYSPVNTEFSGYKGYEFDDPARKISAVTNTVFDGILDKNGKGLLSLQKAENYLPPGQLKIALRTRIFEPTGEYSEDYVAGIADPYSAYVGVRVPESSWGRKYFSREAGDKLSFVVVDQKGNPVPGRKINVGLYEAEWSWWYNRTGSDIYRYNQSDHMEALEKKDLTTGPKGEVLWNPDDLSGYKYLVRVCDEISGHCSGELFYTSNYEYETNDGAARILKLETNKKTFIPGEEIELKIPSNLSSKILVSVENGESVLAEYWKDGDDGSTTIAIPATNMMTPNVYLQVTLIQKYQNDVSELPLRMYGVISVNVENPATVLNPILEVADKLQPKQSFGVKISENNDREMYYTLAIVDEGLLGLTRQETPDPWNHFYAKQALGIKTWDIYDQVLQGFGGNIDKHISIGGDTDLLVRESGNKPNRFDPVVQFAGPFKLEKGGTNEHTFTMDNYLGAVRIMVIGRNKEKYGSAEKSVLVTSPLMILPTLPRTVAPKEELVIPVNVIATEAAINQSNVNIEVGPGLEVSGNTGKICRLTDKKEDVVFFNVSVKDFQGPTFIKIRANGGGFSTEQQIDFNVENPNPLTYEVMEATLAKGEQSTLPYRKPGTEGTNKAVLEISSFPAMNLEKRLDYLIRYPYGCIEQTVSAVFPQLYLDKVVSMDDDNRQKVKNNIQAGISRLGRFQLPSGGLAYWKGSREVSDWGSSYAGHFLLEAKELGYYVPPTLLNNWIGYQKNKSKSWTNPDNHQYQNLMQAYRLYVLAKAGEPEWGAMNILRSIALNNTATYVLAAAYIVSGQEKIGEEIYRGATYEVDAYDAPGITYGSGLRDRALIVEASLSSESQNKNITTKVLEIAKDLGKENWYSTQTTAFGLLAVGKYLSENPSGSLKAEVNINGNISTINNANSSLYSEELSYNETQNQVKITNNSEGTLYVRITVSGKSEYGSSPAIQNNLKLSVKYTDLAGKPLDPTSLQQGTDFISEVSVINTGQRGFLLDEMALSQIFPSGWEIRNERMTGNTSLTISDQYEYRDIRDNAVFTFFDLEKVKTYRTVLTATYAGRYFWPDIQCEAMYDHSILARIPGQWITVTAEETFQ